MENEQSFPKPIHIMLWVAQVLLALGFAWSAVVKLFQPVAILAAMWPWAGEVPETFVKISGMIDLLAVPGLTLPALLRIKPLLTPITALCIIVLMVCASVFHIMRGEASQIGINITFAAVAAFITWGRFVKAKIKTT